MGGGLGGRPPMENQGDFPTWKTEGTSPLDGNLKECPPFEKIEKISIQLFSFSQPIIQIIQNPGGRFFPWRDSKFIFKIKHYLSSMLISLVFKTDSDLEER